MMGTKPTESQKSAEAMQVWQELPTNDRVVEWNINDDTACECCGAEYESNMHMVHSCSNLRIKKQRLMTSVHVEKIYRDYGASTKLQHVISQMYAVGNNGETEQWTSEHMPNEWRDAYDKCPERGHVYVETMIHGLAAETVISVGNSTRLWNGIHTKAMIQMMIIGGVEKHKIRKIIREVRTSIYEMKRAMWIVRNECNFHEDVERERLLKTVLERRIDAHIQHNDAAQRVEQSRQDVMRMSNSEREEWLRSTSDRTSQRRITSYGTLRPSQRTQDLTKMVTPTQITTPTQTTGTSKRKTQKNLSFKPSNRQNYKSIGKLRKQEWKKRQRNDEQRITKAKAQYKRDCDAHAKVELPSKRIRRKFLRKSKPNTTQTRVTPRPVMAQCKEEEYPDECTACQKPGILYLCWSCPKLWHRRCNALLPHKGKIHEYWQCEECRKTENTHHAPGVTEDTDSASGDGTLDAYDEVLLDQQQDQDRTEGKDDAGDVEYVYSDTEDDNASPSKPTHTQMQSHTKSKNKMKRAMDDSDESSEDEGSANQRSQKRGKIPRHKKPARRSLAGNSTHRSADNTTLHKQPTGRCPVGCSVQRAEHNTTHTDSEVRNQQPTGLRPVGSDAQRQVKRKSSNTDSTSSELHSNELFKQQRRRLVDGDKQRPATHKAKGAMAVRGQKRKTTEAVEMDEDSDEEATEQVTREVPVAGDTHQPKQKRQKQPKSVNRQQLTTVWQNVYVGGRAVSVVTQVACDNQHGQRQDGRTEHRTAGPMKDTTGRNSGSPSLGHTR